MLHPRILIKRVRLVVVFAGVSAATAFLPDPKTVVALSDAMEAKLATWFRVLLLIAALAFCAWSFHVMIQLRYVLNRQAVAASVLLMSIFIAASAVGIGARLALAGTPTSTTHALNIAILLSVGSLVIGTMYNAVYVQKPDYTKLRAELCGIASGFDSLIETNGVKGYVTRDELEPVSKALTAARTTAADLVKIETKAYGAFIDANFAEPLAVLSSAASNRVVSDAPESFLRACGLLGDRANESVAAAYRRLRAVTVQC